MREFHAQTVQHPFMRQQRIYKDQVVFEVSPFDGRIHLGCIQSIDLQQGHASKALDWLLDAARQHGVSVDGTVKRVGVQGLSDVKLRDWYKRHGFSVTRQGRMLFDPGVETALHCVRDASKTSNQQKVAP